jgi:hypothetical protein
MLLVPFLPAASGGGVGVGTNNPDTKNPFVFNGVLTLNNPADQPDETYEVVSVTVADQFALQTEPLPQTDGQQSYIPRKVRKLIHMNGIIHAKTLAKLNYMAMQLNFYLDPVNAFWADSAVMGANKGFLPLTFSVPTTDTTNYPTGLISVVAYVRSTQRPVQMGSKLSGYTARFDIIFEMIDPRFYWATQSSVTLNDGGLGTGHTSATEYPTFPTFNLTLSSAPDIIQMNRLAPNDENGNDMLVRIDPTQTLDGSAAVSGDVITFNMATGRAFLNGVLREDFAVPGYMAYWPVLPGANTVQLDGGVSNFSAKTMTYNRAFV